MGFRSLKIGRKHKRYGGKSYHNDPDVGDTDRFYCRHCGFPCSTKTTARRITKSNVKSNKWTTGDNYPTDSDGDYYSNVNKYCPGCGSADWK